MFRHSYPPKQRKHILSRALFLTPALLASAALLAPPAAQASGYDCDASALRASVLGAAAVEPLVANRGAGTCASVTNTLTQLPSELPLLSAQVGVAATSLTGDSLATQKAVAVGGLTNATVKVLPELPLSLPTPALSDALGAVTVPLPAPLPTLLFGLGGATSITIDVRPAINALLPNGKLPNLDVLNVAVVNAYAVAGCANGKAELTGGSQLTGVKLLGQDLPLDAAVDQAVKLVDSSKIDMSGLDLSKIVLPPGLSLTTPVTGPLLQAAIQPVLDALPDIQIPATLAQVKLTPNEQTRVGNRLTQRALHVEVSLLSQKLLDAVIGEASVSEDSVDCEVAVAPPGATELALECTKRRLVLTDVVPSGDKVRFEGVADKELVGKTVAIVFRATDKTVARVKVQPDGSFNGSAKMPPKSLRNTNDARYRAEIGGEESLDLKLMRRMTVTSMKAADGKVTIKGLLTRPLGNPLPSIVVSRRVSCTKSEKVAVVKPRSDGSFTVVVAAPEGQSAAVYRLSSRVQRTARNRKTFPTFTLPRGVNLV